MQLFLPLQAVFGAGEQGTLLRAQLAHQFEMQSEVAGFLQSLHFLRASEVGGLFRAGGELWHIRVGGHEVNIVEQAALIRVEVVQLPGQHIELVAQLGHGIDLFLPVLPVGSGADGLHRRLVLRQHVFLIGLVGVQLQAEFLQSHALEAVVHHLQSRGFFGHEEHGLAMRQTVRNHVRDGLALAGAGWPDEHEILAAPGGQHGRKLRGIRRKRGVHLVGLHLVVDGGGVGESHLFREDAALRGGNLAYNRVAEQVGAAVAQILPHQVFGEGESAEHAEFLHLPARLGIDGRAHDVENPGYVQA